MTSPLLCTANRTLGAILFGIAHGAADRPSRSEPFSYSMSPSADAPTDLPTARRRDMTKTADDAAPIATKGLVMRAAQASWYDALAAVLTRLAPGEAVLDVGCGTGSLALAAKRQVGATGTIVGVDASPEMIALAARKAARADAGVSFQL